MNRKKYRLAAAAVSALAIGLLGTGAPAAFAEDATPVGGPAAANPALINDTAKGSLHITKYTGGDNGLPADGSEGGAPTNPLNQPLSGVAYSIYKVPGVDLTTSGGWASAVSYYNNIAGAETAVAAVTPTSLTTDANGQVNFTGLPLGLYLVKEVSAPAGYTMAAPFLVTLPMTDPDGVDGTLGTVDDNQNWMYDVYVYPKNQLDSITLAVVDKGTQTADDSDGLASNQMLDYVLTSSISDGTTPLGAYVVQLDIADYVTPTGVTVELTDGTTTTTVSPDLYDVYYTPMGSTTPVLWDEMTMIPEGSTITVVFNEAGLMYLEDNREMQVVTTIGAEVGMEDADGAFEADANLIPNSSYLEQNCPTCTYTLGDEATLAALVEKGIPSNMVESKYGDLAITKTDAQSNAPVAGAEFTVYFDVDADSDPATTCTVSDLVAANVIGGPVVTNDSGLVTYKGLQTSDFYNGKSQTDKITYCLVETKAPTGYNLLADPIKFEILQTADGTLAVTNLPIKNEKSNLGNNLPLTGGEGVAALSLGGLALIGGGVGYYAYTSRKRRTA